MSHEVMLQLFDFELRPVEMNGGLRFPATAPEIANPNFCA